MLLLQINNNNLVKININNSSYILNTYSTKKFKEKSGYYFGLLNISTNIIDIYKINKLKHSNNKSIKKRLLLYLSEKILSIKLKEYLKLHKLNIKKINIDNSLNLLLPFNYNKINKIINNDNILINLFII